MALGGQGAPTGALSQALQAHVKSERFDVVTSIRGLPLGVRDELQALWSTRTLDIAEPGAAFQANGTAANPTLPTRRLAAAGCSADFHCLVYYERGGAGQTWLVTLFRWTPAATRLEWGGTAPGGLKTIDEVRSAVLAQSSSHSGPW